MQRLVCKLLQTLAASNQNTSLTRRFRAAGRWLDGVDASVSRADDLRIGCGALARPPSQDTPQVRPCRLLRGIHAA
ncbi:hypothetical protein XHV734_0820 [Xanthomonas hortorum pv. vitians]|nr:hypothetical protein XHV734_0820 [Xanthomonas hortorum pv. vitians]